MAVVLAPATRTLSFVLAVIFVLHLSGCGSPRRLTINGTLPPAGQVTPTPTPTATPLGGFPSPTPTPTPTPMGTGALSASRTVQPDPSPNPTATPASLFIYGTPGFESGSVQAGRINSEGTVSAVAGSPFDEGVGQSDIIQIITDNRGRFVYVLNQAAGAFGVPLGISGICGFSIDQNTGALTKVPGSPIVFPASPGNVFPKSNSNRMVLDGAGHFLFQPNGLNSNPSTGFDVYAVDQSTGRLTKTMQNSNVAPVGSFTAASSDGRFVFNAGNGMAEVFALDPPSGHLTL